MLNANSEYVRMGILLILIVYGNVACKELSNSPILQVQNEEHGIKSPPSPTPNSSVNPLTADEVMAVPNGDQAWDNFLKNGKYRIANETDFKLPNVVLENDTGYFHYQIKNPFMYGDINSDHFSNDCAVIVIDKNIENVNRFGVVVFNQTDDETTIPEPNWVYKNKDLSTAILGWSRDGLSIRTYKENGSFESCKVTWDKQKRIYFCK